MSKANSTTGLSVPEAQWLVDETNRIGGVSGLSDLRRIMSTACNVVIEWGDSRVYFYRHYDGQPADAGASIARTLYTANKFDRLDHLLRELLAEKIQAHAGRQQYLYEPGGGFSGGIEWAYFIREDKGGEVSVAVVELPVELTDEQEKERIENRQYLSFQDFAKYVNTEVRAQNAWLAQLQKRNPKNVSVALAQPTQLLGPQITGEESFCDEEKISMGVGR
jgi:hypothetical protein